MESVNEPKKQEEVIEISDPLGKYIASPNPTPGGVFIVSPYTKKTARWYGGYGAGLLGKIYSKDRPEAAPLEITATDLKKWNALQRFAYRNHTLFFSLGTLFFIAGLGGIYFLTTINVFYASTTALVLIVLIFYFMQTLFLIEGQSIQGSEYSPFPSTKDVVDDGSIYLNQDGKVIPKR